MKRLFTMVVCLLAIMATSLSVKAQEVTISLWPGWTWISYTQTDTLDIAAVLGSFVPKEGDVIKSQFGMVEYHNGQWVGSIQKFYPGYGYMYKSSRNIPTLFTVGTPLPQLSVTTAEPTDITSMSAVVGGTVTIGEGNHIFARGVCWGTEPNPDIDGSHTSDELVSGSFSVTLEGLAPITTYYVRAYVVTDYGLAYGNQLDFVTDTVPSGVINGMFSVSENNQVYFSQGNLQYRASTNTWRFAENQWDYVGESNANASQTYDGWIDLFGWGTSGYNHGAMCYQPWSISENNDDYHVYGSPLSSLYDHNGQADWGYNPIINGGNQPNQWRTLTNMEWEYILFTRTTLSGIRYVKANVNDVNGMVILPDEWNVSNYSLSNANDYDANYNSNSISEIDWANIFEVQGAVFLPASGHRSGNWVYDQGIGGRYWTASNSSDAAHYLDFNPDGYHLEENYKCFGFSVRLVRPAQDNTTYSIEAVPNPAQGGSVTGAGTYNYYDQVTLTANANEGYTFYQWKENGNVISTENSISFVALFDRSLEAVFLENSTYPLLYSYNEDNHTATVTGHWEGVELMGELVIPETVMHNGEIYTVTSIGWQAFLFCSGLTSVSIPNSVISIGDQAFWDCVGLTSVTFGNSLSSIGYGAFWNCQGLTSVEFPGSLVSVGTEAFRFCYGLTEVIIPSSVTSIGNNPFVECRNLVQVAVASGNTYYDSRDDCNAIIETATNKLVTGSSSTVIPNTVTSIGWAAFHYIPISSITIPASVNHIGDWAFGGINTLPSITVLAEVPPTLGDCAFCYTDHSIPVYVPCASIEVYQNAEGWYEFTNFIGVGQCSGMVTVTASPAEYGTVSGGGFYEGSATCTVTATPNEGYYFLCWMEDGQWVSYQTTYTFPVYRDHNLTAVFTIGAELVINGDFEQGNVGFTSEYNYNYSFDIGEYYVGNEEHGYHCGFGHGGTGNFMMIDGATEPGVIVWSEQVSVVPNTYYTLSTWVSTRNNPPALLQFSINGIQVGDVFSGPTRTNTWERFTAVWYSGNSTTATITILDQNTEWGGNDFGLDDISFREMDPVQGGIPTGAINGKFTINEDGDQVYFSQGNLQYQASTNTWKFAENQWDYVGDANNNISSTYDGWIDLFGWGTSGWNSGNTYYHPWDSNNPGGSLYGPSGSYNLTGDYANADWGVYNPISNSGNIANQWRTLTQSEWNYVFNTRTTTSGIRYAKANVNNVNGEILLPDDWSNSTFSLSNTNTYDASYSSNTLTASQWSTLEQAGAVFLPAAGYREGTPVYGLGASVGYYWSASYYNSSNAYNVFFSDLRLYTDSHDYRYYGFSVRLVRVAEN